MFTHFWGHWHRKVGLCRHFKQRLKNSKRSWDLSVRTNETSLVGLKLDNAFLDDLDHFAKNCEHLSQQKVYTYKLFMLKITQTPRPYYTFGGGPTVLSYHMLDKQCFWQVDNYLPAFPLAKLTMFITNTK